MMNLCSATSKTFCSASLFHQVFIFKAVAVEALLGYYKNGSEMRPTLIGC